METGNRNIRGICGTLSAIKNVYHLVVKELSDVRIFGLNIYPNVETSTIEMSGLVYEFMEMQQEKLNLEITLMQDVAIDQVDFCHRQEN